LSEDAASAGHLRQELGIVAAAVEHDAQHHAPRALELARTLGTPPPEPKLSNLDHSTVGLRSVGRDAELASEARSQLASAMQQLLHGLEEALATVDRAAMVSGAGQRVVEAIQGALVDVVRILGVRCAPEAECALELAVHLHRMLDPEAAADEDRLKELATTLRELPHAEARTLARCPQCGAPLTDGDRTFDGSLCETCGTRWYLPSRPSDD
jgi:hypothetical protein